MKKEKTPSKLFTFFSTPTGRRVATFAAGATTIGLFIGNYSPHTFLLTKYQEFVQCYKEGIPRPVPDVVMTRFEKALDILDVPTYERKLFKPFTVFGFDLFMAGSTKSKYGGVVGIPINYGYRTKDDINRSEILFRNEPIKWGSENGQLLQEAIVLSEDEQIFGICKTILQMRTHRVVLNSVFPSVSFFMVYTIGNYLNQKMNLYARALSLRLVMYSILGLFGLGSWSFLKDYNQVSYETEIDKQLCDLGPRFVEAGMSFYDKMLKKNMALRSLTGDDTYTAKGNVNFFLRQKSLPLTLHKAFFEDQLKALKGENTDASVAQ